MKNFFFVLIGIYLGLSPFLTYYFSHGPACPCHALIRLIDKNE